MNEDKATRYHRLRRRALLLAAAWRVFLLAFLVTTGLGHALRDASAAVAQPSPEFLQFPLTVLAWVTVVVLVHDLGALPMAFFAGFLLERRYGLSRQPARSWLHDYLKAAAINLAFAGAAAVWMYAWLALLAWTLVDSGLGRSDSRRRGDGVGRACRAAAALLPFRAALGRPAARTAARARGAGGGAGPGRVRMAHERPHVPGQRRPHRASAARGESSSRTRS